MTKTALLVAGPESSGNRLLVHTLTTARVPGKASHLQPWDNPDMSLTLTDAPDLITFHRSLPHAGDWDAPAKAIDQLTTAGYTTTCLTPVRPWDAIAASLVARKIAPNLELATLRTLRAWRHIHDTCATTHTLHYPVEIDQLNDPAYLAWLATTLALPAIPTPTYTDTNAKHRTGVPHQLTFSFDWTTCHVTDWHQWLHPYRDLHAIDLLTIGAAEGRSECWLLTHFAHVPRLTLTTIEPGYCQEWHARLLANHNAHPDKNKWTIIPLPSATALPQLCATQRRFHVAIIDADHRDFSAYGDLLMTWPIIHPGGTVIMDDYAYTAPEVGRGVSEAIRWALPQLGPLQRVHVITAGGKGQACFTKPT